MNSIALTLAPVHANGEALAALERIMLSLDYTGRCRSDARRIVIRTGCVADCVPECLDAEHLATCEAEYVAALPAVPYDDQRWTDPGSWMTLDDLVAAADRRVPRDAAIVPPELEDLDAELAAYWPGEGDE